MPRYTEPATTVFDEDTVRLRKRRPGGHSSGVHPDTRVAHPVIHNALGMRQHRPIPAEPTTTAIRIGLFGDSFTENVRLPVAFSFSEVLDHLLRRQTDRADVLNFGVDSYGLDQSYLTYLHAPAARHLDQVVYVFCGNDIRNLYENRLYDLDDNGELVKLDPPARPWWVPFASRLALSYLLLDARNAVRGGSWGGEEPLSERMARRTAGRAYRQRFRDENAARIEAGFDTAAASEELAHYQDLARALLDQWARTAAVRADGFRVVLLPYLRESQMAARFVPHRVVDLYEEFAAYGLSSADWTFVNDPHWNELGNLLAAVHLYRELAAELPGTPLTDSEIRRSIHAYYQAFGGWQPPVWTEPWEVPAAQLAAIRKRYLALE